MIVTNIFLILLIIHYALFIIMKPKRSTLSCGLFGWFGKDVKDFSKDKLKILGILNDSRGGDSCGLNIDGQIFIGTDKQKYFEDFAAISGFSNPHHMPVVIGHTRKASVGGRNINNVHPFGFGATIHEDKFVPGPKGDEELISFDFIGAHNGTLLNHEELAKTYKVDVQTSGKNFRRKIDSEVLLECIYKSQSFKPLSDYNGAAALIWTDTTNPNVAYIFRGESKNYPSTVAVSDERPLFYYAESKNSMYVSSIKSSLELISDVYNSVHEIDANTVYKITDGDIENAEKFVISRKDRHQKEYVTTSYGYHNRTYTATNTTPTRRLGSGRTGLSRHKNETINANIYTESVKDTTNLKRVVFEELRYKREGNPITGIYTWVDNYGFAFVTKSLEDVEETVKKIKNCVLVKGEFKNPTEVKSTWRPFSHRESVPLFYFVDGIRILTKSDFKICYELFLIKNGFDWISISHCSTHPIVDNTKAFKSQYTQEIYWKGEKFSGTFAPLGSSRLYSVSFGNCTKIENIDKNDYNIGKTKIYLGKVKSITDDYPSRVDVDLYDDFLPSEDDNLSPLVIENELVYSYMNKALLPTLCTFPKYIKSLEELSDNENAKKTLELLNKFLEDSKKLINNIKKIKK